MSGSKKPKKLWRRLIGVLFSIVSLAVLAYVSISLITERTIEMSWLTNLFTPRTQVEAVDEFSFYVGRDRVFADLGGSFASAGTLGIKVLDYSGHESLSDSFRMTRPAIVSANGRAVAFDIGGTAVRVFNNNQILSSFEVSGAIVSASINQNGWFTVSTQEGGGLRGVTTVFNSQGAGVFRVNLGGGYILSSVLSADNRSLAVLNLTETGSRITLYHGLNQVEPNNEFVLPGELIIDMRFLPNGDLLAISTNMLIIIDVNGVSSAKFEFFASRLGGYIFEDGFTILHLLDYGVGHTGRLLRLDEGGDIIAEYPTEREIASMSFGGGFLAVLRGDGVMFYDSNFEEFPSDGDRASLSGVSRVLAFGNGKALATGEHAAIVFRLDF